ncbi:MAG: toxin-antitoxin system HicB family antitoxin [Lentisphaeria bacterium]|nr:toxin-antitoxin system HicB family antitoxin [Lentisphaeria bacterium]
MSQVTLRLPDSLHTRARVFSQKDHISLNTMIVTALAEKMAALETIDLIKARAGRGKNVTFADAFAEVPAAPPPDYDRIPEA